MGEIGSNDNEPKRLKDIFKTWRVRVALCVWAFNIELVVIPMILMGILGLSGYTLRVTAGVWASVEMCWWIYFSGWISRAIKRVEAVAEAVSSGKEVVPGILIEAKETASYKKVGEFVKEHVIEQFDLSNLKKSKILFFIAFLLEVFGYTIGLSFIFVLAVFPFFGIWIIALATCRQKSWKMGYAALFLGNFTKNFFYAYLWEIIWPYRLVLFAVVGFVITTLLVYKSHKKISWREFAFKAANCFSKKR